MAVFATTLALVWSAPSLDHTTKYPMPHPHPRHHHKHHHRKPKPVTEYHALASWYYDAGNTASGRHYYYGFAALIFGSRWGQKIRFCYRRCVIGQLDDHGPYVGGRTFDLNPNLKRDTGCSDLCYLRWSYS